VKLRCLAYRGSSLARRLGSPQLLGIRVSGIARE
jgi:hypothetical protein